MENILHIGIQEQWDIRNVIDDVIGYAIEAGEPLSFEYMGFDITVDENSNSDVVIEEFWKIYGQTLGRSTAQIFTFERPSP